MQQWPGSPQIYSWISSALSFCLQSVLLGFWPFFSLRRRICFSFFDLLLEESATHRIRALFSFLNCQLLQPLQERSPARDEAPYGHYQPLNSLFSTATLRLFVASILLRSDLKAPACCRSTCHVACDMFALDRSSNVQQFCFFKQKVKETERNWKERNWKERRNNWLSERQDSSEVSLFCLPGSDWRGEEHLVPQNNPVFSFSFALSVRRDRLMPWPWHDVSWNLLWTSKQLHKCK